MNHMIFLMVRVIGYIFILTSSAPPPDKGSNNSGYYNLIGVLTHQGRSSSSGHYVGWTRDKFGEYN